MPVHLALIIVQICFGLWPVVGVALFADLTPTAVAGVRMLFSAPLMFAIFALRRPRPEKRVLFALAAVALPDFVISQLAYVNGLRLSGPVRRKRWHRLRPHSRCLESTLPAGW